MSAAVSIYIYDHTPSGQSRLYRVTRNCVPMAFTAESPLCPNIITAVLLLYILWTRFFPPTYVCTSLENLVYTVQYHMLCFKTYQGTMYYCCTLWTGFYPLELRLSTCKEFIVRCKIAYVVFQNIVITTVL